jgi:hypothetical protein
MRGGLLCYELKNTKISWYVLSAICDVIVSNAS